MTSSRAEEISCESKRAVSGVPRKISSDYYIMRRYNTYRRWCGSFTKCTPCDRTFACTIDDEDAATGELMAICLSRLRDRIKLKSIFKLIRAPDCDL